METLIEGDDGLPATEVGEWTKQKHGYLIRYINISRAARRKFVEGPSRSAAYLDLFCGPGRARIKETDEWIDGSAVEAWKTSQRGKVPFSKVFVADINDESRAATVERLRKLDAPVCELRGSAIETAAQFVESVNPYGLHLAFIDPFSLGALNFQIIKTLASLERIDMLIHLSKMDLQRNLPQNIEAMTESFEDFAPGWRDNVDMKHPQREIRRELIEYWKEKVVELNIQPSTEMKLIRGNQNQPLYWLLLAARHDLARKFWREAIGNDPQGELPLN